MAYNDYGAFVYHNDTRDKSREDTTLSDVLSGANKSKPDGGSAIYAHLLSNMKLDNEDITYKEPDEAHNLMHAVIGGPGDGVYMSVYKYGFWAARIFYIKDSKIEEMLEPNEIFDHLFENKLDNFDEYSAQDKYEFMEQCEFDEGFVYHDNYIRLKRISDEEAVSQGISSSCCSIYNQTTCDTWEAYFDSSYGAGISDCYPGTEHLFDTLELNGLPHPFKVLDIVDREINRDDEVDDKGHIFTNGQPEQPTVVNIHSDPESNIDLQVREFDGYHDWYKNGKESESTDETYEAYGSINLNGFISTFFGDLNIGAIDLAKILNVGIALHRLGIDAVDWCGNDVNTMELYNLCKDAKSSEDELEYMKNWAYFKDEK